MPSRIGESLPRKWTINIWFLAAAGLAAVGAWNAFSRRTDWTFALWMIAIAMVFILLPWWRSGGVETVEVDDTGVRRVDRDINEAVKWSDLRRVRIQTTSAGPYAEDVFFVLEAQDGTGCIVAHSDAVRTKLLEAIQKHLSGVRDDEVIRAMGSTSENSFVIWERPGAA